MSNANQVTEFSSAFLRERYLRVKHRSGLEIYIHPKKMSTAYAVLATRYGSVDNRFRLTGESGVTELPAGVAHFLEHKLFDNPDGTDALARFSALGADANAYTDYDRTAYLFSATRRVPEALEALLHFVTHPYFTEETVKKEQGIIAEEIRMYEDNAGDCCFAGMLRGLYEKNDVRRNICGTVQSIAGITPDILYRAYQVFYSLSNMVLAVSGDVDPNEILSVCDRVLPAGEVPAGEIIRGSVKEPPHACHARTEVRMQTGKTQFCFGIKDPVTGLSPSERLKRNTAFSLLDDILFSQSEPFYNRLFSSGLIFPSWSYGYNDGDTYAYNGFSSVADDPDRVIEAYHAYLGEIRRNGFPSDSFRREKRVAEAEAVRLFDSTEDIAESLLDAAIDGVDLFASVLAVRDVTEDDLYGLLDTAFRDEYETLSVVRPLKEKEKTND